MCSRHFGFGLGHRLRRHSLSLSSPQNAQLPARRWFPVHLFNQPNIFI
jgi:hypothetical protein